MLQGKWEGRNEKGENEGVEFAPQNVFRITWEGTRGGILAAVRALEYAPYILRVKGMSFRSASANTGREASNIQMVLTVRVATGPTP